LVKEGEKRGFTKGKNEMVGGMVSGTTARKGGRRKIVKSLRGGKNLEEGGEFSGVSDEEGKRF